MNQNPLKPLTIGNIAEMCHETNRLWCLLNGDMTQGHWASAPNWQRESAIKGVEFRLENPGAPASAQHEAWLEAKQQEGWVYGPVKDPVNKRHPCFVPYADLPPEQKAKDKLFIGVVEALKGLLSPAGLPQST